MQHINLYSQLERVVEPVLSARRQAMAMGAIAVLMAGVFLLAFIEEKSLSAELNNLEQKNQSVSRELEQLRDRMKQLQDDPLLDQQIATFEREINFRKKIIANLGGGDDSSGKGFAPQLSGLARQHIEGMWFTTIELNDGGQQMALTGRSREPEFVPRYLQKLSSEAVFSGQHFKVLRMSTPKGELGVMDFEIRASDVVAAQ